MTPTVIAEYIASDLATLHDQFTRSFHLLSLTNDFSNARGVFIKPNLTYPSYKKGVTTRLSFVESLVASLRKINSTTRIHIGEGEGGYDSFSMSNALKNMGYYDIESRYPNVKVINLSKLPRHKVTLSVKDLPYCIELPAIFFEEIDFSITCPVPKVHCMTTITLGLKNQWGCIPDIMRLKNHYVFDEIISQICEQLKFRYAFLDGKYGLDQNGPMVGKPVEINWFVASNSLGALDRVVSEMMGFDWRKVGHLKMAERYGYLPKMQDINIIGNIDAIKRKFTLKRTFWNYPALAAFHSRKLTQLVYFSKWAKLLHDIMYTFRKRPID
jgi:uncharacterized protein (DUF362 family)